MKQEIDNRIDREQRLLYSCLCGGSHYIEFSCISEEDYKEYWISLIDTYHESLWTRLKVAFKYIIGNRNLEHSVIGLTETDIKEIVKHMTKYTKI